MVKTCTLFVIIQVVYLSANDYLYKYTHIIIGIGIECIPWTGINRYPRYPLFVIESFTCVIPFQSDIHGIESLNEINYRWGWVGDFEKERKRKKIRLDKKDKREENYLEN